MRYDKILLVNRIFELDCLASVKLPIKVIIAQIF